MPAILFWEEIGTSTRLENNEGGCFEKWSVVNLLVAGHRIPWFSL